jgi:hypothetical protein
MCQRHYVRWRRHGDPHIVKTPGARRRLPPETFSILQAIWERHATPQWRSCEVPGCHRKHRSRGLCEYHLRQREMLMRQQERDAARAADAA